MEIGYFYFAYKGGMVYNSYMKKMIKLEKTRYIIGVSGGPDSMALLDMSRSEGLDVVVAHMNYQLRDTADRDMEIVQAYCEKFGIPFVCRLQNKKCIGNFQAFAREERYALYKEVLSDYGAAGVLLAHHLDDHLETYLMQKKRGSTGEYCGIREETVIKDCCILRPLLHYTKRELEAYCREHEVPYGIDESNLTNHYTRNRIRHEVIDHMSLEEKTALAEKIAYENRLLCERRKDARAFLAQWDRDCKALCELNSDFLDEVLIQFIYQECHCYVASQEISILRELITSNAKNWTRDIKTKYDIYNEYGKLCIDTKDEEAYYYQIEEVRNLTTPYFRVSSQGSSTEAVTLSAEDFPLTIRSYQAGDAIQLRFGVKKVNRWFIDRKIPKKERKRWPVVVNASGNIILVPKIGCDIAHFSNNPTLFVVK